ncbi:CPBP family intramembrane glutamic endopeptidase [Convivina intestini]|uniref:CPBP family intramembrane glutamic endopeptidase n=1 Tax=Convivina intestini TaxID=1505726 RepID=UPI00200E65C2|nr:type II CAAX endopeptidase family protein [Convivina intestini]CAH1856584.1 hypothetical protein R078131_01436 [Convivina intestini]
MFFRPNVPKLGFNWYFTKIATLIFLYIVEQLSFLPVSFLEHVGNSLGPAILLGLLSFVSFTAVIALIYYFYQKVYTQASHRVTKSDWLLILKCCLVFYPLSCLFLYLNQHLFGHETSLNQEQIMQMMDTNQASAIVINILSVFFAPIAEELIFRGFLMKGICTNLKPIYGIIISGITFGALHSTSNILEFAVYAAFGMTLGYIFNKTNKIEVPIALHMFNNGLSTLLSLF